MLILGIETSCDETAAAVVGSGKDVLANVVASQESLHLKYGGVVPEIACRAHLESINPVLNTALALAQSHESLASDSAGSAARPPGLSIEPDSPDAARANGAATDSLEAIAVTHAPGLVGALLMGVTAAKCLSWCLDLPLIAVNHLESHIYANCLESDRQEIEFPTVSLVVSGGHTSLFLSSDCTTHKLLGATVDDAAGEAFDKVAKVLELGYPGGPRIEKAAEKGDPSAIRFPRSRLEKGSVDFSFSGLKTAVLYHCYGKNAKEKRRELGEQEIADVAASFQEAVVDVLVEKTLFAAEREGVKAVLLGGGVVCNSRLRKKMNDALSEKGLECLCPPPKFCTDNAAMTAGLAYHKYRRGETADLSLEATPRVNYSVSKEL